MRLVVLLYVVISAFHAMADEIKPDALILRYPDVSANSIVFVYAGDIWTVPLQGGTATRLSSPPGNEMFPKFSPDGSMIAFSGNYDGNVDVYKMPSEGGMPERLTHHPDEDLVVDWYPGGKNILFRSEMMSHVRRYNRLYLQPVDGGLPEPLPFYYGELASFNSSGSQIAFQYSSRQLETWKRYTGGMASDIWIYNFADGNHSKFTDYKGTDAIPMWHGNTIYFLSDRGSEKKLNIWSYSIESGEFEQITGFLEYDVKWPSIGPGHIVFENAGKLYLYKIDGGKLNEVNVTIPFDAPGLRPELKDLTEYIRTFNISPNGKEALVEARGEVFTVNSENSYTRNHTSTSGSAERYPVWSPDGKYLAYFSDSSGEYNLYISKAEDPGNSQRITDHESGYYMNPKWSPDERFIAYSDNAGNLFITEVDTKKKRVVDTDNREMINGYSWSPDSRWIAYSKTDETGQSSVFIYDLDNRKSRNVSTGFYSDMFPLFGEEGKYLYFYSNRSFDPVYSDFDNTWIYPNATEVYVKYLRKDIPFIGSTDSGSKAGSGQKNKDVPLVKLSKTGIDFVNIENRLSKLNIESGNFGRMETVKNGFYYLRLPNSGSSDAAKSRGKLYYYDIEKNSDRLIVAGVDDFKISADGSRIIYRTGDKLGIVRSGEKSGNKKGRVDLSNLKSLIDPRQEWEQIFYEAWRIERDFFYDPDMHGVDWEKIKERYSYLLPYINSRYDLNYVIGEMIGELNSSHTYVGGGDMPEEKNISVGLPGCDFRYNRNADAYEITRIYEGGIIAPDLRSPLLIEDISAGDLLLEINGKDVSTDKDPWSSFQGMANQIVSITVGKSGNGKNKQKFNVKLLDRSKDLKLRYYSWVNGNRQYVQDSTDGEVGYIYVPDTGTWGQDELVKQFIPQINKKGLIIDERFNSGGQIPDRFIELLNRPVMSYWARRYFDDWKTPDLSHQGPKVMIVNQWAGSGGDAFPFYFRQTGLGEIVGTRTMGALIGITDTPEFIDGGYVTVPSYAFWNTEGEWDIEGNGVEPDHKVEITPTDMVKKMDTQLDKAIQLIVDKIGSAKVKEPGRPVYPKDRN